VTRSKSRLPSASKPAPPDQVDVDNLEILWRWITVPLFLYCLGLWIRSQSNNYEVLNLVAKSHEVGIITGLFATPVALVSLWLAARYSRINARSSLTDRVPRITEKGLDGKPGRWFRLGLFLGLWFVIVGSQIHFAQAVLTGSVVDTTPKPSVRIIEGPRAMLTEWPAAEWHSHDFRFAAEDGPTYFPLIQSWVTLIAVAGLVMYLIWYVFRVLRVFKE
jgi:hypothetical protein